MPAAPQSWERRLALIVETMREMSHHTDPQEMVRAYGDRVRQISPQHRRLSLSRRDLSFPQYRITRSTTWDHEVNPWKEKHRLPLVSGGLLAELIYGSEPRVIDDLVYSPDDPAAEYLAGQHSLLAIPTYDQGESLNMVILLREDRAGFVREQIPDMVWRTNLFGRATANLVLKDELHRAYQALDRELKTVGNIQRALLPAVIPEIPTLELAAHYQPARRAGGDYYDFFPLRDGRWGLIIADVSGHGTPAAVLMAVVHCIAHTRPAPDAPPAEVLEYLNHHLATRYASLTETFVTAFYAIYDPTTRMLTYASAGHNPPRLKRSDERVPRTITGANAIPLGLIPGQKYREASLALTPGDQLVFYTDGVVETHNLQGEMFGTRRLDDLLGTCPLESRELLASILQTVDAFAGERPADDDRTVIVARVKDIDVQGTYS
jgi:sigma-B regulation protein RsbU (phosphoserine phosphatase)